jgi:hypothetical protein
MRLFRRIMSGRRAYSVPGMTWRASSTRFTTTCSNQSTT